MEHRLTQVGVKKVSDNSIKWGYVLAAPGRPSRKDQIAYLVASGISDDEFGPIWEDRIIRGSTRPQSQLVGRNDLLLAVLPGDEIHAHSEFCAALSKSDARWLLDATADRGVHLVVGGVAVQTKVAAEAFAAEVARRQNVFHASESRRTGKKRKRKNVAEVQGPPLPGRRPCVYRHFDAIGALLYVGACINHHTRDLHHKSQSDWWPQSASVQVEYHPTMREALAAERVAIYFEKPAHNKRVVEPHTGAFIEQAARLVEEVSPEMSARILAIAT
ncbi:hypothetical protein [Antarcticimicrobium sediminis]|uniref:GIY-YIG domain-containing protein n=1 Tax=Antarcticimicrobium sediminis TaxID=2546227 RepID=A0A4R5EG08_9RHOB|nr:hypothetical protein [Antarcticimicrobium sediminis]TDE33183.1 hypothetical protein E1B25_21565 [Antarcticimicrobium sediminis]